MAMAQWGRVTFSVSSDFMFTFKKTKRSLSMRWNKHEVIGQVPKMEFQGRDSGEFQIEVILDAELGMYPRIAMQAFREYAERGTAAYFYVGGRRVFPNKLYIASISEEWNEIWNKGELVRATQTITFGEYR